MSRYKFTAKRRAALRKAQQISARKRRRGGSSKKSTKRRVAKVAATGGAVALLGGALVARHKLSGSTLSVRKSNPLTGKSAKGAGYVRPMVVTDEFGLTVAKKTVIASPALRGKRFVATYQHKKLTKGSVYGRNVEKIRAPKKGKKRGKPAVSDPFSHVSSKGKSDPNWSPVRGNLSFPGMRI